MTNTVSGNINPIFSTDRTVHRDLKPENIMLTRRESQTDFVKILDFGLAKVPDDLRMKASISAVPGTMSAQLTKIGALYGTPGYMAPEQAMSEAVDGRCDLYALGSILYEMLTGRTPFDGNTVLEIIDEHLQKPLPAMKKRAPAVVIPEPVEALVRRLLAKRPEERFRDPRELLTALEQLAAAYPEAAPAAEAPPTGDSLIMTVIPGAAPPPPATAARKGTIVALPTPPGSFWAQLGVLQRTLPGLLGKLPLPLLSGMFLLLLLGLIVLPWVLR